MSLAALLANQCGDREDDQKIKEEGRDDARYAALVEGCERHATLEQDATHQQAGQAEEHVDAHAPAVPALDDQEMPLQDQKDRQSPPAVQIIDALQLAATMAHR